MSNFCEHQDIIDLRNMIERFEELEAECANIDNESLNDFDETELDQWENLEEYRAIHGLIDELKGYGGDEQWRGDWYPITLIRDTYFTDYAQELAGDIGAINPEFGWPHNCIDWDRAASELQGDYSQVEFCGVAYWYR